ncbi:MAG: ATP-binding protein [Deltaproteobacteria bacterium]|nr:ATP-binding protein [Deltaproteobacteria bacterium]
MKIKRPIFKELLRQIAEPKISILVGPRQVGKTFLLRELEREARKRNLKTRYFDLEQPADMLSFGSTEKDHFDAIVSGNDIVFVDEMHLLKNISHIFKAVYDSGRSVKIFATGSSALGLHKHLKESMAGRIIMNRIFPLTAAELRQKSDFDDEDILVTGGMPGLTNCGNLGEKILELQGMVSTYIQKDIKSLIKEENIRAFNHLMYLLADKQGSVVATSGLAGEIGLSKPSVENYLEILSQTYVCYQICSYAKNLGNELRKSKKYYLFDLGIRNCLIRDFGGVAKRRDSGCLKESFVCLNIVSRLKPNMELRFWRTKQGDEVDFIILKNRIPFPVEAKSEMKKPEIPKGVRKFLENYPDSPEAIVFNDSLTDEVIYSGRPVKFLKWTSACESMDYLRSAE